MKEYVINDLDIPERVAEHIWEKHKVYQWQVYDVVDDPVLQAEDGEEAG